MLRALEVRDLLLIDRLDLAFHGGLNVLTGETGAGKSILLDALGFVLGWRGRAELVRAGATQGEVTAVFDLPPGHGAASLLEEAGIEADGEVILRRVNTADGRKTAWINDRRASGEVLRALSDTLVELHGQHDDRGLLNPRGHRQMLDAFARIDLAPVRAAWSAQSRARRMKAEADASLGAIRAEEEFLRFAVSELDKLDPRAGEEASLDIRRRTMQASERIRTDVARAHAALTDGAEAQMTDAQRWLEGAADRAEGRLDAPLAALARAMAELSDVQAGVEACLDALDFNPRDLEALEERLFAIRALARKHGVQPDDLGPFADDLRARLAALDDGERGLAGLQKAVVEAEAAYGAATAALTVARTRAAGELDAAMAAELAPLKMERATFSTRVDRESRGRTARTRSPSRSRPTPARRPARSTRSPRGGSFRASFWRSRSA